MRRAFAACCKPMGGGSGRGFRARWSLLVGREGCAARYLGLVALANRLFADGRVAMRARRWLVSRVPDTVLGVAAAAHAPHPVSLPGLLCRVPSRPAACEQVSHGIGSVREEAGCRPERARSRGWCCRQSAQTGRSIREGAASGQEGRPTWPPTARCLRARA